MYKTVRHGENSLQYTILPQNDDFRMENGKLNCSNGRKQYKNKRGKKRSFFAYFGLLFVCTVIIGAVLIPFLVSTQCLPNPTAWFIKTKNSLSHKDKDTDNYKYFNNSALSLTNNNNNNSNFSQTSLISPKLIQITDNEIKNNKKQHFNKSNYINNSNEKINNNNNLTNINNNENSSEQQNQIENKIKNNNKIYKMIDLNGSFQQKNQNNEEINNNPNLSNRRENLNIYETYNYLNKNITKKQQQQLTNNIQSEEQSSLTGNNKEELIINNLNKNGKQTLNMLYMKQNFMNNSTTTTILPYSIKVTAKPFFSSINAKVPVITLDQLNSTKKPIILPVLAKTNSISKENGKILLNNQNDSNNWIKSHWPFIDPSTYFQWTGYKTEDSVLLPAILGVTLISIILLASICLVIRNRKATHSKTRNRSRIRIEESGDDNATLLTTSSLSDDE